jgi:hypothetical protein
MSGQEIDPFEGIDSNPPALEVEPKKKRGRPSKAKTDPVVDAVITDAVKSMKAETADIKPKDDASIRNKTGLIFSIQSYYKSDRFGKYLKSQGKIKTEAKLKQMSIDDLKIELESLDMTIANRGSGDFIQTMLKNGLTMGEVVVHDRTNLKVKGTTKQLFENDRFLDLVERVKLKYGLPSVQLDPALELSLVIVQTAMTVHQQNLFLESVKNHNLELDVDYEAQVPEPVKNTKKNKNKKITTKTDDKEFSD